MLVTLGHKALLLLVAKFILETNYASQMDNSSLV